MADKIKLDYNLANAMIGSFRDGQETLEETLKVAHGIVDELSNEPESPLTGVGGTAYREAIGDKLVPALDKLIEKFKEMQGDIKEAINLMKDADEESKRQLNS